MPMKILTAIRARPRLQIAALAGILLFFLLPHEWKPVTRALIAWTSVIAAYLVMIGVMMRRSSVDDIKARAPVYDEGQVAILVLCICAAVASVGAIVVELAAAKGAGRLGMFHILLATATVGLSWAFVHVMFAMNYAHDYYSPCDSEHPGGLEIPGTPQPHYGDFLYFSFVIGCACATADVNITSREIRAIALVHGVISFFYNTAIVALTINIAAGLLG